MDFGRSREENVVQRSGATRAEGESDGVMGKGKRSCWSREEGRKSTTGGGCWRGSISPACQL